MDLEPLLLKLKEGTLDEKFKALQQAREISHTLEKAAVETLITCEFRHPIAERLFAFGSSIIDPLKSAFDETKSEDVKVFAAVVLLKVGYRNQAVSSYLLEVLEKGSPYLVLAASVLGSCGITEASEILEGWLSKWDFVADPYNAATLIIALKTLTGDRSSILASLKQQKLPQNVKLALAA